MYFFVFNDDKQLGVYIGTIYKTEIISNELLMLYCKDEQTSWTEVLRFKNFETLKNDVKKLEKSINKYNSNIDKIEPKNTIGFQGELLQEDG